MPNLINNIYSTWQNYRKYPQETILQKEAEAQEKCSKNNKKKFGYGADYVSKEKINSPTVRKVSFII